MLRWSRSAAVVSLGIVFGLLPAAAGQPLDLPPVPVPAAPPSAVAPPPSPPSIPAPPASRAVPIVLSEPIESYPDRNAGLLHGDPLLDRPESPPGLFGSVEIGVLVPHIKNRLTSDVCLQGLGCNAVHLPSAELDAVASPRFELGYRFAQGFGKVQSSFRFLQVESEDNVRTRLDLNVIDLDYGGQEFSLHPNWDIKWRIGARLANVFFDSLAVGPALEQQTSNYFFGAGPHVGLDLWRLCDAPGLSAFARLEGAVPLGCIRQSFRENLVLGDRLVGGATSVRETQAVPTVGFQIGLGWTSPDGHHRYSFGYQIEQWWALGKVADSNAELTTQGLFLRGEFGF